jgi:hypothetical protein
MVRSKNDEISSRMNNNPPIGEPKLAANPQAAPMVMSFRLSASFEK